MTQKRGAKHSPTFLEVRRPFGSFWTLARKYMIRSWVSSDLTEMCVPNRQSRRSQVRLIDVFTELINCLTLGIQLLEIRPDGSQREIQSCQIGEDSFSRWTCLIVSCCSEPQGSPLVDQIDDLDVGTSCCMLVFSWSGRSYKIVTTKSPSNIFCNRLRPKWPAHIWTSGWVGRSRHHWPHASCQSICEKKESASHLTSAFVFESWVPQVCVFWAWLFHFQI